MRSKLLKNASAISTRKIPMSPLAFMLTAWLVGISIASANNGNRLIACNNCSSTKMVQAAGSVTDEGLVYVLNESDKSATKYQVYTELLDTNPYTIRKRVIPLSGVDELQEILVDMANNLEDLRRDNHVNLPGSSVLPGSVADILLNPYHIGEIQDFLSQQNITDQLEQSLTALIATAVAKNIPIFDVSNLVNEIEISVEFIDGSSATFILTFAINAKSGEANPKLELVEAFNHDGSRVASHAGAFATSGVTYPNMSVEDWLWYAKSLGVPIVYETDDLANAVLVCNRESDTMEQVCRIIAIR